MSTCPICGNPLGLFDNFTCGACYGARSADQTALGSAAAAQYAGLGAAFAHQQAIYSAYVQQALANQAAGLNGLSNMGVPGLGAGQLMQQSLLQNALQQNSLHSPPSEPLENVGTTFGEFVGWRIWGLSQGYLTSYSANYAWLPGHPTEGQVADHGSGGIWAFKDRHRAFKKALESVGQSLVEGWVTGSVWMYGEVVEHAAGYRSQYATVRSIDELIPNEKQTWRDWNDKRAARHTAKLMLEELRERYGTLSQ